MTTWRTLAATLLLVAAGVTLAPPAGAAADPEPAAPTVPVRISAWTLDGRPLSNVSVRTIDLTTWQVVRVDGDGIVYQLPLESAPAPAPAPAPAKRDDGRAPGATWLHPRALEGIQRPLGLLRALRDLVDLLLALLRAVGLVALYHRLRPAQILRHPLRAALMDAVRASPGLHLAALAEALEANPKTLGHHARTLARAGYVRLARDGRTVRAFPAGAPEGAVPDPSATRTAALALLRAGAAKDREGLAALLGVTPQAVSYHLKVLRRSGRVRMRWMGRRREYEAA